MSDLPERWSDEPWPLDEPDLPSFRPTNWSDTHDEVPQVADLADEAWEYAIDNGVSIERALAELQRRQMGPERDLHSLMRSMIGAQTVYHASNPVQVSKIASWVPVSQDLLNDPAYHQWIDDQFWRFANPALGATVKEAADKLLDDLKRDPLPRNTVDLWTGDDT